MRIGIITLVACLVLAACSTPVYRQANGPGGFGYHTAPLSEGRYRITFRGSNFDTAHDFALLRAAEVTLLQGQDWFRVTNVFSDETRETWPSAQVGVEMGHGHFGRRHRRHSRHGGFGSIVYPFGDSSPSAVHSMEIQVGRGEKPDEANVYDAKSIKATIGPRAAHPA